MILACSRLKWQIHFTDRLIPKPHETDSSQTKCFKQSSGRYQQIMKRESARRQHYFHRTFRGANQSG
jgi:hypothetical protein